MNTFDAYEVGPVLYYNSQECERVLPSQLVHWEDDEDIDRVAWCVFGHLPTGGVDCVADCPDEDTANMIVDALTKTLTGPEDGCDHPSHKNEVQS